jgi:hypothetical protein
VRELDGIWQVFFVLVHWHCTIAGVKACLHVLYISFLIFMERTKTSFEMLTGLQCVFMYMCVT